jgi:hypothetical protein
MLLICVPKSGEMRFKEDFLDFTVALTDRHNSQIELDDSFCGIAKNVR